MVEVIIQSSSIKLSKLQVKLLAETILKVLRKNKMRLKLKNQLLLRRNLTVVLVSSPQMKKINSQFRGKNKVTDVLSFPADGDDSSFGEIILCLPQIKKQARQHMLTFQEEIIYMLLHGILHLLGYDHETSKKDEKQMFHLQDRIFFEFLLKR